MGTGSYLKITNDDEQQRGTSSEVKLPREPTRLALVSTIQFAAALQTLKDNLSADQSSSEYGQPQAGSGGAYEAMIPRSKPLSPGELLGCTAPTLRDVDALM